MGAEIGIATVGVLASGVGTIQDFGWIKSTIEGGAVYAFTGYTATLMKNAAGTEAYHVSDRNGEDAADALYVYKSSDGLTWLKGASTRPGMTLFSGEAAISDAGRTLVAPYSGGTYYPSYSDDGGQTWTDLAPETYYQGLLGFWNGFFHRYKTTDPTNFIVYYSADGISWTTVTIPRSEGNFANSIAYVNGSYTAADVQVDTSPTLTAGTWTNNGASTVGSVSNWGDFSSTIGVGAFVLDYSVGTAVVLNLDDYTETTIEDGTSRFVYAACDMGDGTAALLTREDFPDNRWRMWKTSLDGKSMTELADFGTSPFGTDFPGKMIYLHGANRFIAKPPHNDAVYSLTVPSSWEL